MATRWAVATGNWSNTATWNGGTLPAAGDDVYSNTFTVTIDQDVTVKSLNNNATTGVTAGGKFTCSTNRTITVTDTLTNLGGVVTSGLIEITSTANATINANIQAGVSNGRHGVYITGTGTITINGNVTGSTTISSAVGVNAPSACTLTINGNVTGGAGANPGPAVSGGGGTTALRLTVAGIVKGGSIGSSAFGISVNGTGAAVRIDGTVDWTACTPINCTVPVQFVDTGNAKMIAYSDTSWPTPGGTPLEFVPGGGSTARYTLAVGDSAATGILGGP